jgi:hypothetical protein
MATIALDYLIQEVRVNIGDFIAPYRYIDAWILAALNLAAKKFQRYNKSKYLINADGELYRNTDSYLQFSTEESVEGIIEKKDEAVIILMASIIMLEGSLENSAYSTSSWKDNEISFSNIEGGRMKDSNLKRLIDELDKLVLSPTRRLAVTDKQSLPGYKNNEYESKGEL